MNKMKQLNIREQTYSRLKELGKMGESFSDVIDRILDVKTGIPYGNFGNRPPNCKDPDNTKHVCYKDCL